MRVCVLMGDPDREGYTVSLINVVINQLTNLGVECDVVRLYDLSICPCLECNICNDDAEETTCVYDDDIDNICAKVDNSDCILFATPIQTWFCTSPMKEFLDRSIKMHCFRRSENKENSWKNKKMALLATYTQGNPYGADLFELALKRYSSYTSLDYIDTFSAKTPSRSLETPMKRDLNEAIEFANKIYNALSMDSKIIKLDPFK